MKHLMLVSIVSLGLVVLVSSGQACAQSPQAQPPLSPYLNLLRSGDPAFNYYLRVRPQQQQIQQGLAIGQNTQAIQRQNQYIQQLQQGIDQGTSTLPPTGHPASFMNLSHYFPGGGGGGTGTGLPGGSLRRSNLPGSGQRGASNLPGGGLRGGGGIGGYGGRFRGGIGGLGGIGGIGGGY